MAIRDERDVQAGGVIPGSSRAAFTLSMPPGTPIPVLVAVPHAGRAYPAQLLAGMRSVEQAKLRLEDRFIDKVAEEVGVQTGASLLVAHAPRAMLDLNRSTDDLDWTMIAGDRPRGTRHSLTNRRARGGLGLIPRRLAGIGELWSGPLQLDELDARIAGIHRPYHAALADCLELLRDRWGAALLVDLHSMPPLRPRHSQDRPAEFVIGDRFGASCDPALTSTAFDYLAAHGHAVAHNRPYAGGFVLDRHAATRRGIHAVQIEVCRSSYLDSQLCEVSEGLPQVARRLAGLVRQLADRVAMMGRGSSLSLAAE